MQELISKADVLLEALPYVQRFHSQTFGIKCGGGLMDSRVRVARPGVPREIHLPSGLARLFLSP